MKKVLQRASFAKPVKFSLLKDARKPTKMPNKTVANVTLFNGKKDVPTATNGEVIGLMKKVNSSKMTTIHCDGTPLGAKTAIHAAVKVAKKQEADVLKLSVRTMKKVTKKNTTVAADGNECLGLPTKLKTTPFANECVLATAAVSSAYDYTTRLKAKTPSKTRKDGKGNATTFSGLEAIEMKVFDGTIRSENEVGAATIGVAIGEAVNDARNLGNLREDEGTPAFYADWAKQNIVQRETTRITDHLVGKQLEAKGLNLFHGVGRAAIHDPHLVVMEHRGDKRSSESIALVGKGVTFDSGGMNVKPFGHMETMHMDMMGAATVLATMRAVQRLNLPINVVGVVGLCENAIGPTALQPSSIITSLKGSTVEITNTDAEGRLVLADCLTYLQRDANTQTDPKTIIDLATLTGACLVALGSTRAGAFSNDATLMKELYAAGCEMDERIWPMPIGKEHEKVMKGTMSDLTNCVVGREAGSCTAAAFLKHFIEDGYKWAHLDIAGPGIGNKAKGLLPDGAPGFGVKLLMRYLLHHTELAGHNVNAVGHKASKKILA